MWLVFATMGASYSNLTVSNQMRGGCPPLTEQESQLILSVRDVTISAELIATERGMPLFSIDAFTEHN